MHVEKRMKQVSQMILFRIAIIFLNQQESNISTWDTSKAINVIVWKGPKGDNTHCTTNLNMKEWATAKS